MRVCAGNSKQQKLLNLTTFYSCYDDLVFDYYPVEVNRWYHSCFARFQEIFIHSLSLRPIFTRDQFASIKNHASHTCY